MALAISLAITCGLIRDLDSNNFERLVFHRKDRGPSFIKFYAPWCAHCKKLAPDWKKVEKAYERNDKLLVGNVDCSDGPPQQSGQGGRNPLCDKYRAMALPTILYFYPPTKKASHYDGNKTTDNLLAFAAELVSDCSFAEQDACTDEQKAFLTEFGELDKASLKEKADAISMRSETARMQSMMVQMEMQQAYGDKSMSTEKRDEKMKTLEEKLKAHGEELDAAWEQSPALRAMQMIQRHRKQAGKADKKDPWSEVHELSDDDDFDPMDMMHGGAGMGGSGATPPPPPPKPPSKTPRQKREARGEVHTGECIDKGPWPCEEKGCPGPKVSCKDLRDDCTSTFSEVFASPPEEMKEAKVWEQCPKSCDRCKVKKGKAKGKKETNKKRKEEL